MTQTRIEHTSTVDLVEADIEPNQNIFQKIGRSAMYLHNQVPERARKYYFRSALAVGLLFAGPQIARNLGNEFGHGAATTIKGDLSNYSNKVVGNTVNNFQQRLPGLMSRELSILNGDVINVDGHKYELVVDNGHLAVEPVTVSNQHSIEASPPTNK